MGGPVGYPTRSNCCWFRIDGFFSNERAAHAHAETIRKQQRSVAVGVVHANQKIVFPLCTTVEQHDQALLDAHQMLDDELRAKEIDMALRQREAKRVSRDTEEFIRVRR